MTVPKQTVPKHIGIIMDGNRRFSRRLMAEPWKGHEWGAEKVMDFLTWCHEAGVQEVTLYAFSVQNFERSREEFDALMNLFEESFQKLKKRYEERLPEDSIARSARVVFIGRLGMFPEHIQAIMREVMDASASNAAFRVNIAMGYGGREEVIDAVKRIGEQVAAGSLCVEDINADVFASALYIDSEPDLVIRTGGERRTSNFLLWQSHYSEWFFVEKLWPEFEKEDFLTAIASFTSRDRRYGK
jgi:tritrans,polycis-undecaprenyl-diphosphate synthase [geranylgeranyl-diphosphate specific]